MPQEKRNGLIKALAISAAGMVCLTRISMAVGEIFNGLVLLFGLILFYYLKGSVNLPKEIKGYIKAYFIFVLCTLPSVFFGGDIAKGLHEFLQMWIWRFVVFLPVVAFIRKRNYLINMLTAYTAVFGVDCFVTLIQVVYHLGNNNRGWGLGGSSLGIASIMCMMLPLAFIILLDKNFEQRLKRVTAVTLICNWIAIFCNKSRGSWVTSLILIPLASWEYIKHSKKLLAAVASFFIITGVVFNIYEPYAKRFESITNVTTDRSNGDRIEAWKSCVHMVQDHPATGIGLGMWSREYVPHYWTPADTQKLPHAHSNYFHLMAETGLIGLAGLLYFTFYYVWHSYASWRKDYNPYDLMLLVSFLGYVVFFGQIEYTLDLSSGVRIMWFLQAVLFGLKFTKA